MLPRDLQTVFEKLERYKIAIGDVWEWSDIVDGTSKTLMLKLGTNIHLEHGIKALIQGVENLYLDDVDGIQNVVYQLNGEGFPLLKYLHVQNNANMKHIVDSKERTQIHVSFPILETLVLDNLKNLEHICLGPLSTTSFRSLGVIKVKHCVHLKYLFSFTLVKELSHLSEIEVCHCNSMKEIVLGDNNSSENSITNEKFEVFLFRSLTLEHMETLQDFFTRSEQKHQWLEPYISTPFFNAQVSFPNLDTLKLSSLNLGKFWDDNHQSMCNLTSLIVENCGGLKYLFSSTMVGSLNNLKQLEISNCHLMEEIIVKEETNNEIEEDVHFFNLEKITLKDMDNLKTIWHREFETVKQLEVINCKKIVVVFPSSMQTTYTKLEMLEVTDCALVEEIFELSFNENSSAENTTHLKVVIDGLPELKNIWSGDLRRILSFQILIFVKLTNCESLEYLLPLPIATRCSHLQELHIDSCENMKEIVAEENESGVSAAPTFEFNQLTSLSLLNMLELKGFYAKKHTLTCPSLKEIDVFNCAKLNLFRTLSTRSSNFQDDKLSVLTPQPPFIVEEVIPNLKELKINRKEANVILQTQNSSALFTKLTFLCLFHYNIEDATFPYWFLQNVQTLETLVVEWSSFKKIFQDEGQISEKKTYPQLKKLTLNGLHKLQHICEEGFQIDPVLAFLENLDVDTCSSLLSLLPSSATLNHLEYLDITNCNGLTKLITSPTAQSLHKLISLKVKDCNSLEEIITGEENVGIAFISLELLLLDCLPSLNKFCSTKCFLKFPMLAEVIVRECPRMKIFSEGNTSTPNLRKVKIAENDEWLWKGNLNDTITNIFEDKVAFGGFKQLKLAEYPELKELWYGQPQHNLFRSLKYLVVHECDFLSEVLFQPNLLQVLMNLEELDITDCDSLEAVFDMKGGEFEKEILVKNSTQLKKLTLSNLPNLKHVWKEDQHNTMGFQNLSEVYVEECPSLKSLFPLSVARDMNQIQTLEVNSCGIEEIVGREEGVDEIVEFVFPNLTSIVLHYLAKLKTFFGGVHSLQCKSLNTINVFGCPKIKLFKAEPLRQQESARNDHELNISTYQPLFVIEEVLATVENFYMNAKYFDMILHSQYSGVQFNKIKDIGVGECYNKKATFPYGFLKNVPNLETILVQWSSFREIFQGEQLVGTEMEPQIIPRLKELKLWYLKKLQCICKEGLQMDPILNFLESIDVQHCSSLMKLVPSSVTFNYLTYLEVTDCNGLINLITYSTAKSLVKLETMKIEMCNRLEDIINSKEEDEMNKIEFYSLKSLELISLPRLSVFSSCPCPIMFPLLEVVVVKECPRMKHFSLDLINTTILQNVQFDEEEHWEGELNGTVKKLFYDKKFGGFKQLKLSRYPELKELWYGQPQHNLFRSLKYLVVHKCDFLSEVLFQPNLLEVLMNLEELDITDCDSLEAVFDMKSGEFEKEILVKNSTQLKKLKLSNLPKLMHVWKENQHNTMGFQNLSEVYVEECTSLKSLFPLSVARDMNQIQTLEVTSCGIEEIVGREEGVDEIVEFVFPNLTSIRLHHLAKLKTFFAGVHSLQCKSLKTINLFRCPEIELFKAEPLSQQVSARNDELNITTYQPLFVIEEVFNTVESLFMNMKYFDMILHSQYSEVQFNKVTHIGVGEFYNEEATFPHWFLKNVPNLESMLVQWSSFREIFQGEQPISTEMETQIIPRLKELELWYMDKLQCICKEGLQMDPILHFLETIYVRHCSSLMKLVPSSVTFNYLTYLEVTNCNGLTNLITYSTAKSLVKLTTMKIEMCNCLEDVVNGKEEDEMNKIEFSSLQYLELVALPKLCLFCSCTCPVMFPLLEVIVVKGCPRMEHFSFGVTNTTILENVQFDKENHWEGDLNGTVKKLFDDKVAFGSFKHLKLSEYPELKELWYGRPQHNVFRSLKYLVVHKCDFLSEVLFQPNLLEVLMNLEELDITDCDSLEAVFDMKDEFEKESLVKNSTRLKKLKLSNLPKLKHVWKEDQHNTIRFQNLSEVSVEKCTSLKSLFPLSVARDMKQIQSLKVCESGIEEIVGNKEGTKEMVKFVFPHLTSIHLSYLAKLKAFFAGVHSLRCKSLKKINLFGCPKVELFRTGPLRHQESAIKDELNISMYQPLFVIDEVLNNVVESLNMNFKYFDMILHSQYSGVQFNKVNYIGVSECYNEEATFPYRFLKNVPNLKTILVEWSSFREIFKGEQLVSTENETQIIPRLQVLELWHLDKLQCICKEGLQMDPVLHFLESIHVQHCSNLVKLMPSSVTFNYLTYLEVTNCNGLTNLITYSTAKSLVKLETMKIEMCNRLEDIINSKEEDEMNKIEFYSLKSLELISLPRLSVFCSCPCPIMFPLLEVVVVKGCPRMEHFSSGVTNTTILQNVQFDEENHWEGDLNGTVKKLFDDKEVSHSNVE